MSHLGKRLSLLATLAALTLPLTAQSPRDGGAPLNLLFYGNSYSSFHGTVPNLVGRMANEAGLPTPNVVPMLVGGSNLAFHRNDPTQVAAITTSLPAGEQWDYVVIQGWASNAAATTGDPATFRDNAMAILANVRAHSPNARAVLFHTWPRAPGHSYYPGTFASPYRMHLEVLDTYRLTVDDMNQTYGSGTAFHAEISGAMALLAFDTSLYDPDLHHPSQRATTLAAMVHWTTIYGMRVCDLDPDFSGNSLLVQRLQWLGIEEGQWDQFAGIADRVATRQVRPFAGTGDDLLLRTGVDAAATACPIKALAPTSQLGVSITSPNQQFTGAPFALLADAFATGSPPGPIPGFPALHFGPATAIPILGGTLTGTAEQGFAIPTTVPGASLMLQAIVLAPSPETGAPLTATDAHELRM